MVWCGVDSHGCKEVEQKQHTDLQLNQVTNRLEEDIKRSVAAFKEDALARGFSEFYGLFQEGMPEDSEVKSLKNRLARVGIAKEEVSAAILADDTRRQTQQRFLGNSHFHLLENRTCE